MKLLLSAAALLTSSAVAERVSYQGHSVYRVHVGEQNADAARELIERIPDADVWKATQEFIDVRLSPEESVVAEPLLKLLDIKFDKYIEDIEALASQETMSDGTASFSASTTREWFSEYHTVAENSQWLEDLYHTFSATPGLDLELVTYGKSHEGRDLTGLKFTGTNARSSAGIFFNGHLHSREWITTPAVQYVVQSLLEGFEQGDRVVVDIVNGLDWIIVPTANPDGYQFSIDSNRLWRKTRSPTSNPRCIGVDPNRNFPYQWGGVGSSSNPCADDYRGETALSEVETEALYDLMKSMDNLQGYIDFHAYGNWLLYPWGYRVGTTPDEAEQDRVANLQGDGIRSVNGASYVIGPAATTLYPTSGDTTDSAYGDLGAVYSWTAELTKGFGFQYPASRILEACEENWAGVQAYAGAILNATSTETHVMY